MTEVNTVSQDSGNLLFKLSLAEALEEVATSVTEEACLNNEHAINICFNNIHLFDDLVSSKDISCIYLILYIIQTSIVAVSDDGMALCLESCQIIDYLATKEGAAVFQCRLVDDNLCALCLDTFHDSLNGRLAEVVGVGFHRQTIDTNDA